jgi:hypothetical protein
VLAFLKLIWNAIKRLFGFLGDHGDVIAKGAAVAGGAAAAGLPPLTGRKKNEAARELPQTRRLPLLFCRGSWYTKTDTPLRRGEKSFVARL